MLLSQPNALRETVDKAFIKIERAALQHQIENAILSYVYSRAEKPMPFNVQYSRERRHFLNPKDLKKLNLEQHRQDDLQSLDNIFKKADRDNVSALALAIRAHQYLKTIKVGFKLFWLIQIGNKSVLRDQIYHAIQMFDPKIFYLCEHPNHETNERFDANSSLHQYGNVSYPERSTAINSADSSANVTDKEFDTDDELQGLLTFSERNLRQAGDRASVEINLTERPLTTSRPQLRQR